MKLKKKFKINKTYIFNNSNPYIIGEIGSNHNQKISIAKKLIDIAHKAKCNAVKFQIIYPEGIAVGKSSPYGKIKNKFKKFGNSLFELYSKCSLKFNEFQKLRKYCKKKKIDFIVSVFCKKSLKDALKLNVDAIKIASLEIYDNLLLNEITKTKKPIIISSGTASLRDITLALKIFKKNNKKEICLLHCISSYPAKDIDMNINFIKTLNKRFQIPIGLSDHTLGSHSAIVATSLGAAIIEKHITLNKKFFGPDHFFSLNPKQLINFVKKIKHTYKILGKNYKIISDEEKNISLKARRSIFSKTIIKKNKLISKKNIKIVRPANGLKPEFIYKILNKKIKKTIAPDTPITLDLID